MRIADQTSKKAHIMLAPNGIGNWNMLIFLAGNAVVFLIAFVLRRTRAVILPIVALGLFGALVASNQSVSLRRSDAPPRRTVNVTDDYREGYLAAVELVKRSEFPLASIFVNLVLISSVVALASRQSRSSEKK
jgi:hypothetical protein